MNRGVESGKDRHGQTSEEASAVIQVSSSGSSETVESERSGQILDRFRRQSRWDSAKSWGTAVDETEDS